MPKKQPRNAFYFFMLDYKARCERNGEKFPRGLKDVQEEAGPEWNQLPASARKKYEDMAKEEKARLKGDPTKKYTNQHNSFDSVDRQKIEEEELKQKMNNQIESTIRSLKTKTLLAEHKFYLIHVNYYCISEGECFHPAELAVAEFSLGEGVTNVYHTIIDPGQIPLGYRFDAIQKSESSHKIPLDCEEGEKNFYKILMNIKKVLEPGRNANGGVYPPLFTMPDNVNLNTSISCVKSVIRTLCETTDEFTADDFPIYSLEKLFYELKNACADLNPKEDETNRFPSVSLACMELERDVFNYTPTIACRFHLNEDAVECCSQSFVQRWVFLICDHCCTEINVTVIPGRHLPENTDLNYRQRQEAKQLEEAAAPPPKPITWIDHSKKQSSSGWVPVQERPLPPPRTQPAIFYEPIDTSEDNFPAIPLGRGRGRVPRGGGRGDARRGGGPQSFADAMRSKK